MPTDELTWPLLPHTQAKHDILQRYLNAWFPIMARYASLSGGERLVYIDGFAGPGEYDDGENGSPVIVLNTLLQHSLWSSILSKLNHTLLFIELDSKRADHLEHQLAGIAKPANVRWQVVKGAFEPVLTALLDSLQATGGTLAPAFVFIDPFGPEGFPMKLVRRILGHQRSEVLITLNLRRLNQSYLHTRNEYAHADDLYGCQDEVPSIGV